MYWFVIRPGGEIVSADETEFHTSDGTLMGRWTPQGGSTTPFRSLLAAYRAIRNRDAFRPTGRYADGGWTLRRGLGYGYIAEWTSDRALPSGTSVKITYEIVPTPRYGADVSVTVLGSGRILEPGDEGY